MLKEMIKTVYEKLFIVLVYSGACLQNKRVSQYTKINWNMYRLVEETLQNVGNSVTLHIFNTENRGMVANLDYQLATSRKDPSWGLPLSEWSVIMFVTLFLDCQVHCGLGHLWAGGPRLYKKGSWGSQGEQAGKLSDLTPLSIRLNLWGCINIL